MRIALQPSYCGRERLAVMQSGYEYYTGELEFVACHVPVGSVEWVEKQLGYHVKPDYYPTYLTDYLHRKVGLMDHWPLGKRLFVKPADEYKKFTGFVTDGSYRKKKRGALVWSTPVTFDQEWRYYVAHGDVLTAGWYDGYDEDEPAPALPMELPRNVCGAFDFGRLRTGEFALVEYQHPFACGWYGESEDQKKYVDWLIAGWEWMKQC